MKKQSTKGFTIIEVVLVLAIAALIFLMVFVALPTLQRNQRDNERKTDVGLVSTAVGDFVSANRRAPKNTSADLTSLRKFVEKLGQYQPSNIVLKTAADTGVPPLAEDDNSQSIWVHIGSKCDGESVAKGTTRQAAVRVQLENKSVYCVDAAS